MAATGTDGRARQGGEREDAALVRLARDGDRAAFAALLGRHWELLLALCRRALGDPELARDAAQEAALQAMLGLDRLRQAGSFGPWLGGIGLNVCRSWLRYRPRDDLSWEALQGGRLALEFPDDRPGPGRAGGGGGPGGAGLAGGPGLPGASGRPCCSTTCPG